MSLREDADERGSTGEWVERRQLLGPTRSVALLFCQGALNVNLWPEV